MTKIYVAIPSTDGKIYFELSLRLMDWYKQTKIPVVIVYHPFLAPIDHARNVIVSDFLRTDCTHLMMIDDDIVPTQDTLERLLVHDQLIVGAACPIVGPGDNNKLVTTTNAYNLDEDKRYTAIKEGKGLQRVNAVGTGCMMIKREVFDRIPPAPFVTEYNSDGIKFRSEDLNFCFQAESSGIYIYVDFDIRCKHIKSCNILDI